MADGALAGREVIAGRVPDIIARTTVTADSSTITSEASVMTVSAFLFEGRVYAVRAHAGFASNTADDRVVVRLRETNVSGQQHTEHNVLILSGSGTGFPDVSEFEFQAGATGSQTFALTAQRVTGTGTTTRLRAASDRPATLTVTYVRG